MTDFDAQYGTQLGELKQNIAVTKRSIVSQRRDNPPLLDRHQRKQNVSNQRNRDNWRLLNIQGAQWIRHPSCEERKFKSSTHCL